MKTTTATNRTETVTSERDANRLTVPGGSSCSILVTFTPRVLLNGKLKISFVPFGTVIVRLRPNVEMLRNLMMFETSFGMVKLYAVLFSALTKALSEA